MKRTFNLTMKFVAMIAILSFFSSGCTLIDDILRALSRLCATPVYAVTTTADIATGLCTTSGCSLRQAVLTSNACPGTQTISIPAGTYVLSHGGAGEDAARTGDLDLTDSVDILGTTDPVITGTANPVIDGNGTDRVFDIMNGASVDMSGLVIQNGQAEEGGGIRNRGILHLHNITIRNNAASGAAAFGGGILSTGDALMIDNLQVQNNSALNGGGIAISRFGAAVPASFELANTLVFENSASRYGGGLWLNGQVTASLSDFEFNNNTATGTGDGGGIENEGGTLHLARGAFVGNRANGGSALESEPGSTLTAMYIQIQDNSVGASCSALSLDGQASFSHSAIVGNLSDDGTCGGIDVFGSASFDNTTISGNQGVGIDVGGSSSGSGSVRIDYSTIADNTSFGIETIPGALATLHSTIMDGNSPVNCAGRGTFTSSGYNLDSGDSCGFSASGDISNTDPLLLPLTLDAGTYVHALDPTSPARDSADPSACPADDQRGYARPSGTRCDIGAFEFGAGLHLEAATPPAVTVTNTPGVLVIPPTETPTATVPVGPSPTPNKPLTGLAFLPPGFSTDHFYSGGGGCGPLDLKLQVGVSDPAQVSSVVLFFHLEDKAGGGATPWNEGVAMQSMGGGQYSYDLVSNTIPAFNSYPEAWLVYQFAATNGGQVLLRSPAFKDVTLSMCGKK